MASDHEFARQVVQIAAGQYYYVPDWAHGMAWTGKRWEQDKEDALLQRLVVQVVDGRTETSARRLRDVMSLVKSQQEAHRDPSQWDSDPWLLNTPAGTYDLREGINLGHRPGDLMTRLTARSPEGDCPRWREHLRWCVGGDRELGTWLQRYFGYGLTGLTREQIMAILVGSGANGKSVVLDTLLGVLGDYATVAPPGLVTSRDGEVRPDAVARMHGVRLAVVSESEVGHRINEGQVKMLTGDARLSARKLYGSFFEFTPTSTYVMATNHKPKALGNDEGLWRRLRVLRFGNYCPPAERNPDLTAELIEQEGDAILQWLMVGALHYSAERLPSCQHIEEETRAYRQEMDMLGGFLAEECVLREGVTAAARSLYSAYERWANDTGNKPWPMQSFQTSLRERGYELVANEAGRYWRSIGLRSEL